MGALSRIHCNTQLKRNSPTRADPETCCTKRYLQCADAAGQPGFANGDTCSLTYTSFFRLFPHEAMTVSSSTPAELQLPRFLVLLAARNGANHLERQLRSILSQRDVCVEIHIGDDASTDETAAIAESLADARIHVHRRPVATGSAAQNFLCLIRDADGSEFDYVSFSDQDDIWMPHKLRRAALEMSRTSADGYSSSVIALWPDGRESVYRQSASLRRADFLFEGAGQGCTFVLASRFFAMVQDVFRTRQHLTT
jgi:hypothetical protein